MFGALIDSSCIYWQKQCSQRRFCAYYNNDFFRNRYLSPAVAPGAAMGTVLTKAFCSSCPRICLPPLQVLNCVLLK